MNRRSAGADEQIPRLAILLGAWRLAITRGTQLSLALAGSAGSGKSTIARELAAQIPSGLVYLDDSHHNTPPWRPSVPAFDGTGRIVSFSDSAPSTSIAPTRRPRVIRTPR